jgi:tetratricopeptide (TPR) repeat protein
MNILRNRSQWFGPSQELMDEAKATSSRAVSLSNKRNSQNMLAKMELDFSDSKDALQALAKDADDTANTGAAYEAFYSQREHLIARRKAGEKNLDANFQSMLLNARKQGNKRAEPTIYREYAQYLLDNKQVFESLQLFGEALRLTRVFGWTLHEPALLEKIIECHYLLKDRVGMFAAMGELEKFLKDHPNLPQNRRYNAFATLAIFWSEVGDVTKAQINWDQALAMKNTLPEYQTRWVTDKMKAKILMPQSIIFGASAGNTNTVDLQPTSITSLGNGKNPIRAHFSATNRGDKTINGHWVISGASVSVTHQGKVWQNEDQSAILRVPDTIHAGHVSTIIPQVAANEDTKKTVNVAWENENLINGQSSLWEMHWGTSEISPTILDASFLSSNPFHSLSLYHEIEITKQLATCSPCRIKCSVPLRLEYYDSKSKDLLAIDANGNGDFTEEGDLYIVNQEGLAACMLPLRPGEKQSSLQVMVFSTSGEAPNPSGREITLTTQVFYKNNWATEAENILK